MSSEISDNNAPYDKVLHALLVSEEAITATCAEYLKPNAPLTLAHFVGMGIARRASALSSGFRSMVDQRNSLCALPIVRMQLDTALRLYAGFFVSDHQAFCNEIIQGKQIDRIKADDGEFMRDRYLVERIAKRNPWVTEVYKTTSGYIHFSFRHIQEAVRSGEEGAVQMIIGPHDFDREPKDYLEPMRCILHLNLIIEIALKDWLARMCNPNGVTISARELWSQDIQDDSDTE